MILRTKEEFLDHFRNTLTKEELEGTVTGDQMLQVVAQFLELDQAMKDRVRELELKIDLLTKI